METHWLDELNTIVVSADINTSLTDWLKQTNVRLHFILF